MKKNFYQNIVSLVLVISGCCFSTNTLAQVTVGIGESVTYGALLDIKNKQAGTVVNVDDDENITSTDGGLLLPRVKLDETNLASLATVINNGDAMTTEQKLKLAGLMVYNINKHSTLFLGVYIWGGSTWTYLNDAKLVSAMIVKTQPIAFSFYETGLETPEDLIFEVLPPRFEDGTQGTVTYQWYKSLGNNKNSIGGQIISGANSSVYTPTVAFHLNTTVATPSTLYAGNNGLTRFFCIAQGSDGSYIQSNTVEVAVGCGAKNTYGQWVSFMCFNLGADNGITIEDQLKYPIGTYPTTSDPANAQNLWGSLFQWGRVPDGHEKRNSITADAGNGVALKASIANGYYCTRTSTMTGSNYDYSGFPFPFYQIKPGTNFYGKFIINTASFNGNWYPQSADVDDSINQLWRSSLFQPNDPCYKYKADGTYVNSWTMGDVPNSVNSKSSDPACVDPKTEWRTPLPEEFGAIYQGGTISGGISGATSNIFEWINGSTSNYVKGIKISPYKDITTLYLPAAGSRHYKTGAITTQEGSYSTVSISGVNSLNFYFNSYSINITRSLGRGNGMSIRCVKN